MIRFRASRIEDQVISMVTQLHTAASSPVTLLGVIRESEAILNLH